METKAKHIFTLTFERTCIMLGLHRFFLTHELLNTGLTLYSLNSPGIPPLRRPDFSVGLLLIMISIKYIFQYRLSLFFTKKIDHIWIILTSHHFIFVGIN